MSVTCQETIQISTRGKGFEVTRYISSKFHRVFQHFKPKRLLEEAQARWQREQGGFYKLHKLHRRTRKN